MTDSTREKDKMISEAIDKYADTVRKISFMFLKNMPDVEDVFQEVFLKLLQSDVQFESEAHEKAWICKITINKCKDLCKSYWRKNVNSIYEYEIPVEDKVKSELFEEVMKLKPEYKEIIYLFYYEGYNVPQIAKLLEQKENTTYSNLRRAREQLKLKLGGTDYEFDY